MTRSVPTFVLGIDGATFRLLDLWIDDLPNFSKLLEDGFATELRSSTPPVTSPAWRCYATGKDPASIGVYWWRQLDRESQRFVSADDIPLTSKCYWEFLSDDKRVAVVGVPLNAPPRPLNGYLVSGGPFADQDEYTYPAAFQSTLESKFDYQLHPDVYPSIENARDREIISDFEKMLDQRFDLIEWFLDEKSLDLVNLTLFYINVLQHKAWDAPEVKHLWKRIDERLGTLLNRDINVIIHSDHGLHEVERVFYLNGWLKEQGYLSVDPPAEPSVHDRLFDTAKSVLEMVKMKATLKRVLPESTVDTVRPDSRRRLMDTTEFETRVDFENSRAIASPQGPVYILDADLETRTELRDRLFDVTDPETGEAVFADVKPAEEVYAHPIPDAAPDLLVEWNDGFEIKDIHSEDPERIFGPPYGVLADNEPTGILLGSGPDITAKEVSNTPLLYDLAPTFLHLHDEPIPESMDGSVLFDIFADDSEASARSVRTTEGEEFNGVDQDREGSAVSDRLRDLGYLE
ncbi:hypothetical protein BV210_11680 [Halorientalis sp. IM1011]|uniref:alkaline phosphatase family protein n=1 Tax=Halorientalis sp. IM1011 TaxID=1932360 RepID=UPI00097CC7CE|nr:alkaline phosphatase family protein [Halorientalis sp. IM1011]AQL43311.1 hypothetical protein BV210_11680 [Halorientalis sp. IM1011]